METPDILSQLSTPKQPNPPIVSLDPSPQPKKSLLVLILLSVSILIFAAVAGYFYLQSRSLRTQLASSPTPTSPPTPQPSIDPTATWQSYVNEKFNFSFTYPQGLVIYDGIQQVEDRLLVQNFEDKPGRASSDADFQIVVRVGNKGKMLLEDYPKVWEKEFGKSNSENVTIDGVAAMKGLSGQKGSAVPTVWIAKDQYVYSIQLSTPNSKNANYFDQILSTFQFLDEKNSNISSSTGYKYSNTVVAFEPPLSNSDYSDIRAELTAAVVEPFIDFYDAAYGKGSVVSLLISSSDNSQFPYKLIGIGKSSEQTYELLNKEDDGYWWTPTCMGKCPVPDSIRQKYVDMYKFVE